MRNVEAKLSGDSWGYRGRWQVNVLNTCATLGDRESLTPESFILYHNLVVLHEVSHALSGVQKCWSTDGKRTHWDKFLMLVVN